MNVERASALHLQLKEIIENLSSSLAGCVNYDVVLLSLFRCLNGVKSVNRAIFSQLSLCACVSPNEALIPYMSNVYYMHCDDLFLSLDSNLL